MTAQGRQMAQERALCDAEARSRHRAHGAVCDRLRRLKAVCYSLGAPIARRSDDRVLAGLFQATLDRLRAAEAAKVVLRP